MRTFYAAGGVVAGGYLCSSVPWETLLGTLYFAAFALMALLGLFYRDPTGAARVPPGGRKGEARVVARRVRA